MVEVQQWEYQRVETYTVGQRSLIEQLNVMGAEGWEVVGFASSDKTVGFNSLVAIARRPIVPPAPANEGTKPDWLPDPTGRWEIRYWDGARWTAHVANRAEKKRGVDPPQTLASAEDENAASEASRG